MPPRADPPKNEVVALVRALAEREPQASAAVAALSAATESLSQTLCETHKAHAVLLTAKDSRISALESERDEQKRRADKLEFDRVDLAEKRQADAVKLEGWKTFADTLKTVALGLLTLASTDEKAKGALLNLINAVPSEALKALKDAAPTEFEALKKAL